MPPTVDDDGDDDDGSMWVSLQFYSYSSMKAFHNEAIKLAAMGVSIVVSSGDDGVSGGGCYCDYLSSSNVYQPWQGKNNWAGVGYFPDFPATDPYVTAVGATMGPNEGGREVACDAGRGAVITSGGGFSTVFGTPQYQRTHVKSYFRHLNRHNKPKAGFNNAGRGYPDVAMLGTKYQVVVGPYIYSMYGTSASAPVFAAFLTLVNSYRLSHGKTSVGFVNPTLYGQGRKYKVFYDVKEGHNKCCSGHPSPICCAAGFTATSGWDPVTGFGSVRYDRLITMLK